MGPCPRLVQTPDNRRLPGHQRPDDADKRRCLPIGLVSIRWNCRSIGEGNINIAFKFKTFEKFEAEASNCDLFSFLFRLGFSPSCSAGHEAPVHRILLLHESVHET